jgi:hypothetical protein
MLYKKFITENFFKSDKKLPIFLAQPCHFTGGVSLTYLMSHFNSQFLKLNIGVIEIKQTYTINNNTIEREIDRFY